MSGGVSIAGVDKLVIRLTRVTVGTSLPELASCVAAIARQRADVVPESVLGSNIFNLLGVLGIASLIAAVKLSAQISSLDL